MPHRQRLEALQVGGEMPRHPVALPDHVVARQRGDDRDRHTAIGALMAGWGS